MDEDPNALSNTPYQRYTKRAAVPQKIVPCYLKTPEAAIHLGLSPRTLEKFRCFGGGPVFRKLGGRVVYAISDLEAWAEIGTRRSTSDPGIGTIHPAKRQSLTSNQD